MNCPKCKTMMVVTAEDKRFKRCLNCNWFTRNRDKTTEKGAIPDADIDSVNDYDYPSGGHVDGSF